MENANIASDTGNGAVQQQAATTQVQGMENVPVSWHSGMDQDTLSWLENRGITKLNEQDALKNLASGFRNAEKFIGTPADKLLKIPDFQKASREELDGFYSKIGRPESPDKYELDVPEGQPTDFADWAKSQFHALGLSNSQAKALSQKWNEYVAQQQGKMTEQSQAKAREEEASLRQEWGGAYDNQLNLARNAAQAFGVDAAELDRLESAMGYAGVMKFMARLGARMGESEYVSSNSRENFGAMTPSQAASKIADLRNDKDWVAKYLGGNVEAKAEMERLMKQAYPGM